MQGKHIELKGIGYSLVIALVLGLVTAAAVYFTPLPDSITGPAGSAILILSVFAGSVYVAYHRASRGLIRGLNFGAMIFILMLILTLLSGHGLALGEAVRALVTCLISGALGGAVGVAAVE